ncbi:Mu-like prophage major head subunit gpT family protein [Marinobacter subterrani]|uniref:Mu-like prophage major head subunit gpT n=1 Tax=Marinobacter subterrani TaxID=1658765 RepID=A0A0J7J630_9GAMM|nr:Mu-like prophage major head subunit gpT family protein [Marinobacter subterrani]KMQ74008.1 Mu-like prophage major head subunit gpT [Marinobacter subterrani]
MIVNKSALDGVFFNLKTTFNRALKASEPEWQKIAMKVTSTSSENRYKWMERFPAMRKWAGEKVVKQLKGQGYTIINDDFEATIEVDRNDIEDDTLGIYGPEAEMAGYSSAHLPDELVFDLVNAGFTELSYDGQPFFDTDHPVGKKDGTTVSVSNKGTSALSHATLAAAQASFGAGRTALRKMKDDEERPLNINPSVLLVPPALEDTARALMTVDRLEDGKPNPYKGAAEVVVSSRLTSDTAWFLLDTTKPVKPFIYQERKAPVFVSQTNMDSDSVFLQKKYRYGAEARGAAGFSFWQMAYGSTGQG